MNKKLTNLLFISVLSFGALLASPGQTQASSDADGVVVKGVNFRTAPKTSSSVIRLLKTGESVDIQKKVNKWWYQVRDSRGQVGYASTSYIKESQTEEKQQDSSPFSAGGTQQTQAKEIIQHLESENISTTRLNVIKAGFKYLGTPYEFGSDRSTTKTFDSSDILRQAYLEGAKVNIGADHRIQADYFKKNGTITTSWSNLKPGDKVFLMSYKGSKKSDYNSVDKSSERISHGGIYLGHGLLLHSYSKESGGVRIDSIEGTHWEYQLLFGGSILD